MIGEISDWYIPLCSPTALCMPVKEGVSTRKSHNTRTTGIKGEIEKLDLTDGFYVRGPDRVLQAGTDPNCTQIPFPEKDEDLHDVVCKNKGMETLLREAKPVLERHSL